MGLWNRYKTVRDAEKRAKNEPKKQIDTDELDDFDLDAGDALEAEIQAELARERKRKK
jgi:hypothetical protein